MPDSKSDKVIEVQKVLAGFVKDAPGHEDADDLGVREPLLQDRVTGDEAAAGGDDIVDQEDQRWRHVAEIFVESDGGYQFVWFEALLAFV